MSGIRGWGDARWQRTWRGMPTRGGCFVVKRLVRAHFVVGLHEGVEDALLQSRVCRGRFRRLRLEHAMHAFVRAVLLRTRGRHALMHDAELQPPRIEAIQPMNAVRGKGSPVVTANRLNAWWLQLRIVHQ